MLLVWMLVICWAVLGLILVPVRLTVGNLRYRDAPISYLEPILLTYMQRVKSLVVDRLDWLSRATTVPWEQYRGWYPLLRFIVQMFVSS